MIECLLTKCMYSIVSITVKARMIAKALGLYGRIVGLVMAYTATEKGSGLCSSYES